MEGCYTGNRLEMTKRFAAALGSELPLATHEEEVASSMLGWLVSRYSPTHVAQEREWEKTTKID
jgi:hypothetical protein